MPDKVPDIVFFGDDSIIQTHSFWSVCWRLTFCLRRLQCSQWVKMEGRGEDKKKGLPPKFERSPVVSDVLNEVRTFFEGEEG